MWFHTNRKIIRNIRLSVNKKSQHHLRSTHPHIQLCLIIFHVQPYILKRSNAKKKVRGGREGEGISFSWAWKTLLHACSSACLHVCMPACLQFCISACLDVCVPALLHFCNVCHYEQEKKQVAARKAAAQQVKKKWKVELFASKSPQPLEKTKISGSYRAVNYC